MLILILLQGSFYVMVHTTAKDLQRYKLSVTPYEKVASLLEKALRSFNRTLGPDEQGEPQDYILKVRWMDKQTFVRNKYFTLC